MTIFAALRQYRQTFCRKVCVTWLTEAANLSVVSERVWDQLVTFCHLQKFGLMHGTAEIGSDRGPTLLAELVWMNCVRPAT